MRASHFLWSPLHPPPPPPAPPHQCVNPSRPLSMCEVVKPALDMLCASCATLHC